MRLYLVQHGNAVGKEVDPDRPLSADGMRDVDAIAAFLAPQHLDVPYVWHSGKTRARQTTERLAPHVAPHAIVEEHCGLAPKDDVRPVAEEIRRRGTDLMIVGHLPFLARLAAYLLTGEEHAGAVTFKQGGIVCLDQNDNGMWTVAWAVTPALLPGNRSA